MFLQIPSPSLQQATPSRRARHWVDSDSGEAGTGSAASFLSQRHSSVTVSEFQSPPHLLILFLRANSPPGSRLPRATFLQLKGLSSYPNQAQLSGEPQGPTLSISRVVKKEYFRWGAGDNTQFFSHSESGSEDILCGVTASFGGPNCNFLSE